MSRLVGFAALALLAGAPLSAQDRPASTPVPANPRPTVGEAQRFVRDAERRLDDLTIRQQRAQWVQSTFITDDTELMAAQANEALVAAMTELGVRARRFAGLKLPDSTARKLKLLQLGLDLPAPSDPRKLEELTRLVASMEGAYGRGSYCPAGATGESCLDLGELSRVLATSRNPDSLRMAWTGWHDNSRAYRGDYARYVQLANEGAREAGFADAGAMWRAKYDMPADAFAAEEERLWQQVRPLYLSLHAYVRAKLVEKYGASVVPPNGPIPAHLLGNMWSQDWSNIYPMLAPPAGDPGYRLDDTLVARKADARQMVKWGEGFYRSLGFDTLPATFWARSQFTKPRDRDVVCHASAWDLDAKMDVRIKMCIEPTDEDFKTIHHELGHNYYQMAYRTQPYMFQNGANDGFHEAIGDAIALSITPDYLKQLGFIQRVPDASSDVGLLLNQALSKVAFLPFGYLVDRWRWEVFSGKIPANQYNAGWWRLRTQYQGIAPPEPRTEQDFDAGAKYHVAANVPYARYFLAAVLQFQFYRAMCREAGYSGPLHRCSVYGNKAAGEKLAAMLRMGASRPWPEALKAMTGEERMDATAMLEYFAPLKTWLDEQNRGRAVGW
jgi:peptidyl-dipeptidase A